MSSVPVKSDLDLGGVARVLNLPAPASAGEPVRNDDSRLGGGGGSGYALAIGDQVISTQTPTQAGATFIGAGIYSDATYPALAALIPQIPAQSFEVNTMGTGAYFASAAREGAPWGASTSYVVGDYRKPTAAGMNSKAFRCTTEGTSSSSEPTWPSVVGNTVTDGGAVWTCEDMLYVTCKTTGVVLLSTDHCKTFKSYAVSQAIQSICFSGRYLIAVTNATFYLRSLDGKTWERINCTTSGVLRSVASDGKGKVLFNGASGGVKSDDHGATSAAAPGGGGASSNGFQVVYCGLAGSEFVSMGVSAAVVTIDASTWGGATRAAATSMDAISVGNGRLIAWLSTGTTTAKYLDLSNIAGAWTNCAVAAAACTGYFYSVNFARWYGMTPTNNNSTVYHSTDGAAAWGSFSASCVYGIGKKGFDTGDGKFVLLGTNTTFAVGSNIQRLATATTGESFANVPYGSTTITAIGEAFGTLYACSIGSATVPQMLKYDATTGDWVTVVTGSANFTFADRFFDLGSGVAVILRGTANSALRSTDAGVTWPANSIGVGFMGKNADGSIVIYFDNTGGVKRTTDRLATAGSAIGAGLSHSLDIGFTAKGYAAYNATLGRHYFPGVGVNMRAAIYWVSDDGATDGLIETTFDNAQFDFIATKNDGSLILALSKALGQVWGSTDNGATWSAYCGGIAAISTSSAWAELLWVESRKCFLAMNISGSQSSPPIWASPDGRKWRPYGDNVTTMARMGYSATLDLLAMSINAGGLMTEVTTVAANQFQIEEQNDQPGFKRFVRAL